ncbi:MAG: hypothetical protein K2M07_05110 [Muribaculaceae bacterium]|nr:hypothetical protein [Muribaculaceae bacterium]
MTEQIFLIIFFAGLALYGIAIVNLIRMYRKLSGENGEQNGSNQLRILRYIKEYPQFRLMYMVVMLIGIALLIFTLWWFVL